MNKLFALIFFMSFGASAGTLCLETRTEYPVAIDVTFKNYLNQSWLQRFEIMPVQYFCYPYSDLKIKSLSYLVHGFDASCTGEISGRGKFTLVVLENGCRLFKGPK